MIAVGRKCIVMEIRNCRVCGKMMQYNGLGAAICPGCKKRLEEKFTVARKYLKEYPGATINELADAAEVPISQVNQWIREERLVFTDDSPIGIDCERCGKMIKSGKYCPECKKNLVHELASGRKDGEPTKARGPVQTSKGKMRFLDR